MPGMEPTFDSCTSHVPPVDSESLLAEMQQVLAETITHAESRRALSSDEREQAAMAMEEAMESTRRMVERLTIEKS
ncbi:hypothetical protein [Aeoliella sp. SH292]|uniref:hypothetical protein n=1 Tax=Aeoliella sp. SH292 TaxID=3454464 RepID=UPI003F9615F4